MFKFYLQLLDRKWQPVHVLLVKNQKIVINLFFVSEWLLLMLIPVGFWVRLSQTINYGYVYELGSKMGTISFLFYLTTLIPGILKRFKILPLLNASMMLFRRHLGISMFLSAIIHLSFVSLIPKLFTYSTITLAIFTQREVFGLIAILLLFPLWLTSNDFSVTHLGKYWRWVHNLTYIALFLIFLHVVLLELSLGLFGLVMIIAEVISWIVYVRDKKIHSSGVDLTAQLQDQMEHQQAMGKNQLQVNTTQPRQNS